MMIRALIMTAVLVAGGVTEVCTSTAQPTSDPVPTTQLAAIDAQKRQQNLEAIQMEILKQRHANKQLTIREISNLQAEHHELMKKIIDNMGPSGRYEYNPATGRYDRYVPRR